MFPNNTQISLIATVPSNNPAEIFTNNDENTRN